MTEPAGVRCVGILWRLGQASPEWIDVTPTDGDPPMLGVQSVIQRILNTRTQPDVFLRDRRLKFKARSLIALGFQADADATTADSVNLAGSEALTRLGFRIRKPCYQGSMFLHATAPYQPERIENLRRLYDTMAAGTTSTRMPKIPGRQTRIIDE